MTDKLAEQLLLTPEERKEIIMRVLRVSIEHPKWLINDLTAMALAEAQQDKDFNTPITIESGWIRVSDRLPSGQWNINHPWLSEEVLIANSCAICIGFYNRNNGTWYVDEPAKEEWIDKIRYWMPLPINPHDMSRLDKTKTIKQLIEEATI